jgi:hypothetical protein
MSRSTDYPSGLFASGFPTNILYAFLFAPFRPTFPAHLILLDLIILVNGAPHYAVGKEFPDSLTMRRMACAKTVTCRVLYGFGVYCTSTEKRKG